MRCLLILALLLPLTGMAETETYCDDPAVWADWALRAQEAPEDSAIQTLHGLWIGLCTKIKEGSIRPDMAIELFEEERARLAIQRAKEEMEASKLSGT
jgi:hypothetical protein